MANCKGCGFLPKVPPKHFCEECNELRMPIDEQKVLAAKRLAQWNGVKPTREQKSNQLAIGYMWCGGCASWRRRDAGGKKFAVSPAGGKCRACVSLAVQRTTYKLSPQQQDGLLLIQKAACAACGRFQRKQSLCVDHDHSTDLARGLLDIECNDIVGIVHDSPARLIALACFLIDPPARRVGIGEKPMNTRELAKEVLEYVVEYRKRLGYDGA